MSPSEVTVAFLLTNDPSALDQDTRGHGFPLAEHLKEAVVPFKTVSFLGEIVTFGAEHVWPGNNSQSKSCFKMVPRILFSNTFFTF